MKLFILGILVIALTGIVGWARSDDVHYTLKKVTNQEEASACGKAKGLAAFVADVDEEGTVTQSWIASCLYPVEK